MNVPCPPYPPYSANPQRIYCCLQELHAWLLPQVTWANETARQQGLRPTNRRDFLYQVSPITRDLSSYLTLSVASMLTSLGHMQQLRVKFDAMRRHVEGDADRWESEEVVPIRLHLCFVASLVLRLAFLDDEKRQAVLHGHNFQQQAARVSQADHWTAQDLEHQFWYGTDQLDQS